MEPEKDMQEKPGAPPEENGTVEEPESAAPESPDAGEEEMVPREMWLLAMADLNNVRKRTASQISTALQNERRSILTSFLDVLDSLQLALEAHEGEENDWVEGTKGIHRQMSKIFTDLGVEPIESLGAEFDPNIHEAVARVKMPDRPDGTVIEELRRGYRFQDGSLLRPARVVVSGVK